MEDQVKTLPPSMAFPVVLVFTTAVGALSILCLFRPSTVQRWIVAVNSRMPFFPFRKFVSSPAYIPYIRFGGALAVVGTLFGVAALASILAKL